MSDKVLLVAPPNSYRLAAYLQAARELGISAVIASEGRYALVPDFFNGIQIDLTAADAADELSALARQQHISGVVATDDSVVELAGRVAHALGLPGNDIEGLRCTARKDLARARLAKHGVRAPRHWRVPLDPPGDLAGIDYPCVAKPLALSGSRGVIRCNDAAALHNALQRIRNILAAEQDTEAHSHALVEAYLPGVEIAVEGLLRRGELQVLAVFDKPEPLQGPFFEESYYITPSRHPAAWLEDATAQVAKACRAYGLREGPIHAELRIAHGTATILEVAARTIGGQCGRLLQFGTGLSLEKLVIRSAIGQPGDTAAMTWAAGVLMLPIPERGILRRVEGVSAAKRLPLIEDLVISIREGYELIPAPEGASYLGFMYARGETPAAVEAALRTAHGLLTVVVAPVLSLQTVEVS